MFEYSATILSIVDADTFKLEVDLGFNLRVRERFRLARVNAPERMSIDGMKAVAFVTLHLSQATAIKISSEKSRQEKYGRWLCELWFQTADSKGRWQSLNQLLLDTRHAVPLKR